jgi:hypothetical protein
VKLDLTPSNAERYCAKNGMSLYDANRSPAAAIELAERVKLWFGWPKATFTTEGRVGQRYRCSIINGVGKFSTAPCNFANHFFCEYAGGESFLVFFVEKSFHFVIFSHNLIQTKPDFASNSQFQCRGRRVRLFLLWPMSREGTLQAILYTLAAKCMKILCFQVIFGFRIETYLKVCYVI